MIVELKTATEQVRAIARATGSRKRSVMVDTYHSGETVMTGWDGGSKDSYHYVDASYRMHAMPMTLDTNRQGDPHGQRYVLEPMPKNALAVVRLGTFCGKPATPHIYLPEEQA